MAHASARHSFHGPLLTAPARSNKPRRPPASAPLELVTAPPITSSLGRAVLKAARDEGPSSNQRERILAGVLAALRGLTSANR